MIPIEIDKDNNKRFLGKPFSKKGYVKLKNIIYYNVR
jgi:hypothetical protein